VLTAPPNGPEIQLVQGDVVVLDGSSAPSGGDAGPGRAAMASAGRTTPPTSFGSSWA